MTPKYTFLLPAFKGKYLDEMLKSIKAQTYTDFKVLISDDCSPENLKSICEPYLCDPRFSYRRNEENMGLNHLVEHWQMLVDMCETDFFIMAGDDDIYDKEFLTEIDALTKKYPNTDLFRGRVAKINEEGRVLQKERIYEEYWNQHYFYRIYFNPMFMFSEANYAYRTDAFKKRGGYVDFPLAWFSDCATHLQMADNGVANTPNITFYSRASTINVTGDDSKELATKKIEATFQFVEWIKKFHVELGEYPEECYLMRYALYDCKYEIKVNILKYLPKCSLAKFIHYINIAHRELDMSRLNMIYTWIRLHK